MKRALRVVLIVLGVLVVLAVIAGVAIDTFLRRKYEPAMDRYRADAKDHLARFEAIRDEAIAHPFFAQPRPEEDAGPWLNPRIPWEPAHDGTAELAVPKEVTEQLKAWGQDWLTKGVAAHYVPLDTAWMGELHRFGHWDLVTASPIAASKNALPTMPIPNFIPFQSWTKLRLIEGVVKGELPAALKDTRQLAWLAYASETLLGEMIALALLRYELALPAQDGVPYVSKEELEAWKGLLWGAMLYANLLIPKDVYDRAFPRGVNVPGHCAGLNELSGFAIPLRRALEDDFADRYALLDDAADQGVPGCRLTLLHHFRALAPKSDRPLDGLAWIAGDQELPIRHAGFAEPWVARRIGMILATIALPGGFDRLDPPEPKPKPRQPGASPQPSPSSPASP